MWPVAGLRRLPNEGMMSKKFASTKMDPLGPTRLDWSACEGEAHEGESMVGLLPTAPAARVSADECVDRFPQDIFSYSQSLGVAKSERDRSWWLAHTRPRQEKALAADLAAYSVAYYLPLVKRKSLTRGRTRVARIPLFPSYVFLYGNDDDRLQSLKTNRILTVQKVDDGDTLRRELLTFAELIALGAPLVPEARLTGGDRVRVKSGPFRDREGTIIRRNGKTRLLVALNYLQQGASLEIDDCFLEPA